MRKRTTGTGIFRGQSNVNEYALDQTQVYWGSN
jgi:hypothetical protein